MCFNFILTQEKLYFIRFISLIRLNSFIFFSAFSTRLFSVLRFESVIHEFDP